jgi:hypothetical protein
MQGLPATERGLLLKLAIPDMNGTFRANPGCATKPTALATCWQRSYEILASNSGVLAPGAVDQLPVTDTLCLVFRDPANGVVLYDPNIGGITWLFALETASNTWNLANNDWIPFTSWVSTGTYAPYGNGNAKIDGNGHCAAWMDVPFNVTSLRDGGNQTTPVTTKISLNVGIAYNTYSVAMRIRRELNGMYVDLFVNPTVSAGVAIPQLSVGSVAASGYVSVQYISNTLNANNLPVAGITVTGNCSVFSHIPMAQWTNLAPVVDNASVNSATVMFTNTTAPLTRQGQMIQLQVAGGTDWAGVLGLGQIGAIGGPGNAWLNLSQLPGAVARPSENGGFSFLRPTSSANSFTRRPATSGDNGDPPTSTTTPADDYLLYYVSNGVTGSTASGYWTITHGLEYETEDLTREALVPDVGALPFLATIDKSTRVEQHHTNSFHIADLIPAISGVISGKDGGLLGALASTAFKALPLLAGAL